MAMLVTISKKFSPSWTTHFTPSWTINAIPLWIRIFLHEPTNKKMLRRQDSTLLKKKCLCLMKWQWNIFRIAKTYRFFFYISTSITLLFMKSERGHKTKKQLQQLKLSFGQTVSVIFCFWKTTHFEKCH